MTRAHEYALRAGRRPGFEILQAVADGKGSREVDIELARRTVQHPGLRLPAVASHPVRFAYGVGMMRTVVPCIDASAGGGEPSS